MRRNCWLDGGGNGAVERALGNGEVVRVLGGARLSAASAREGSGEGENERE